MYILKNALKCLGRSKGRNILIGIIALVISISACLGLSIRQAAENAKQNTLDALNVTATISFDRQSMMGQMRPQGDSSGKFDPFDKDSFKEMMGNSESLTLEQYETYSTASTVKDFYYTLTLSLNGGEGIEPVTTEQEDDTSSSQQGGFGGMGGSGGFGDMNDRFNVSSGDFSILGYSSEDAMTAFANGTAKITDGSIFEEGTENFDCVISEELSIYNGIAVGDEITLLNPSNEEESYVLTVVGIYTAEETNDMSFAGFGSGQDPANKIYMSATAANLIKEQSEETVADLEDVRAVSSGIDATYVFANVEDYEVFATEVYTLGLDESYTVSSGDITAYENSLTPLNTLSEMAGGFLIVILIIGGIILVVLNIFNVRERKYEIGVLTAMGMKKWKVALQFVSEILIVTMIAIMIGIGVGAVSSVPVTNALLESQSLSEQNRFNETENNFGRLPENMGGNQGGFGGDMFGQGGFSGMFEQGGMFGEGGAVASYITEIDSAMNFQVVWQMLGIGILLTLIASAVSVLFIMRYDPLRILANRD